MVSTMNGRSPTSARITVTGASQPSSSGLITCTFTRSGRDSSRKRKAPTVSAVSSSRVRSCASWRGTLVKNSRAKSQSRAACLPCVRSMCSQSSSIRAGLAKLVAALEPSRVVCIRLASESSGS